MMSDHLCSMNETLTKQREEIDTLKLANKVSNLNAMSDIWFLVQFIGVLYCSVLSGCLT